MPSTVTPTNIPGLDLLDDDDMEVQKALGFSDKEVKEYKEFAGEIKKAAEAAASAPGGLDPKTTEAINKAAAAARDAARQAVVAANAFRSGDVMSGTAAVMDICSSAASVLGSMQSMATASGAGAILGALFGIISLILRACAPPQKSVTQVMEQIMRTIFGEEKEYDLNAALSDYQVSWDALMDKVETRTPLTEKEFDELCPLGESGNTHSIYKAGDWLANPENQSKANKEWHAVLEAYLLTGSLQIRLYALAFNLLDPDVRSAKSTRFKGIVKQHQTRLKKLKKPVQDKSLLWCLAPSAGDDITGRSPYVRCMNQTDWTELSGEATDFSVTRPAAGKDSLVVTLEGAATIDPHRNPGSTSLSDMLVLTHGRAYARSVGLDFDGGEWKEIPSLAKLKLRDIHAVPDDKDSQAVRLYWTHDGGSGVSTYSTETRKVTKARDIGGGGTAIRAVPGRKAECYYVLNSAPDAKGHSTVRNAAGVTFSLPIKACRGIAVCPTFLWAFNDRVIYCVTHEAAGEVPAEAWRFVLMFGTKDVQWLSPADDQMLIVVVKGITYTVTWSPGANGQPNFKGPTRLVNGPSKGTVRIERQLVRAWPLYKAWGDNLEKLIATPPPA